MEPMKVSFGFSKLTKKTNIISNKKPEEKKVDLIECLEEQSIKLKDTIEEVKGPLVIPIKDNEKNLLDRVRAAKQRAKPTAEENEVDERLDSDLSVDELAARQLIKEAKEKLANGYSINNSKVSVLPVNSDALPLEGEREPTLEDYESVPISDYGLALLRGMGWKEGTGIGKNTSKSAALNLPELRPKGLGLGATKVVKSERPTQKPVDKDGNELGLVKGGFAKVIAGPQKGNYCEIQGFDEEAGRVIIKVYPKAEIININEFLVVPVLKQEFSKGSKIINNAKYEEYKEISDKKLEDHRINSQSRFGDIKKENIQSDSEDERKNRKHNSRSSLKKYSPDSDSEKEKLSKNVYKQREESSTQSASKKSEKNRLKKSKYKGQTSSSDSFSASSDEELEEKNSSNEDHYKKKRGGKSSMSKSRHRSRSKSVEKYYKRNKKHTKSKTRDKSRSRSRERNRKSKKDSRYKDSSDSDSDCKKERRKKNKCKSRHKRNSSSSSDDRRYKSRK